MENIVIALVILAVFVFVVSLASIYVQEEIAAGHVCGCSIPINLLIPLLSSTGLIVGVFVYYYATEHLRESSSTKEYRTMLKLVQADERRVIEALIASKEALTQAKIAEKT